jgi:hypothetical protein
LRVEASVQTTLDVQEDTHQFIALAAGVTRINGAEIVDLA